MDQHAASTLTSQVGDPQALSLSPSPSGRPVRRVAIISFQITKKGPTLWSPHWGAECHHTPEREEFHTRLRGGAGLVKQVMCLGMKCFYEAPSKRPDGVFGLQLTSPSSSISRDLKNKEDGSSWQLMRPTAESGPPPPPATRRPRGI